MLHTYRAPGSVTVTVTAVWSASYAVAGQADAAQMGGTLTRASTTSVPVREYAANLVP